MTTTVTFSYSEGTLVLNGTTIQEKISGNFLTLTHPNDNTVEQVGSNGFTAIQGHNLRDVLEASVRVIRDSAADFFLRELGTFDRFPTIISGTFARAVQDSNNVERTILWTFEGGNMKTRAGEEGNNEEAAFEQEYVIRFTKGLKKGK